jgi:hypothetical protein
MIAMRKKMIILFALFLLFLSTGFTSCTKKQAADTPFNMILGKWKKTQYATDDNNSGVIDPSEIHNVPSTLDDELLFTNEANGVETTVSNGVASPPLDFDWKIVGGDSVWVAYVANDTLTYYLANVDAHNLQLNINTPLGLAAYYYAKE